MGTRVRRRLTEGERLAYRLNEYAAGHRGGGHRGGFHPVGPTVRIVCECGRRLHVGTGTGPAGWRDGGESVFTWRCDRCDTAWEIPAMELLDAWLAARAGDRTVRLPLAQ